MPNYCGYTGHDTDEEVRTLPLSDSQGVPIGKSIEVCHKHWEWEMEARWRGQAQGRRNPGFVRWNSLERRLQA